MRGAPKPRAPHSGTQEQSKTVHVTSTAAQSDNKEPINIQAAKLDYFDKQQKLIYRGHVIAVQGDTTLKTPQLVVFLNPKEAGAAERTRHLRIAKSVAGRRQARSRSSPRIRSPPAISARMRRAKTRSI